MFCQDDAGKAGKRSARKKKPDYRLKSNASFRYVFNKGAGAGNKQLTVVYAKTRYGIKAGFSVGAKLGNSVKRNRIKRVLRESFRALLPEIERGYNYVFVAKEDIVGLGLREVSSSMRHALKKAGRLIKPETDGGADKV
ncbi:MAG: ribonuclease P protein component [Clostridiales bacterium]|jgi:ribonuclease P protein component|nr:ribonuclease P protein component [Clostridiales bacterium]